MAAVQYVAQGRDPEALRAFVPLLPSNVPAWNAYSCLSALAGETGEIRVADIAAHCDFLGIRDTRLRRRIYRHVSELRREHRRATKPASQEGSE